MNRGGPGQPDPVAAAATTPTLDAYVDGLLAGPTLTAFEARLASDATLAAEIQSQRYLDRALRGAFVVPPFPGVPTNGHPTDPPHADPAPAGTTGTGTTAAAARRLTPTRMLLGGLLVAAAAAASWVGYGAFADRRLTFDEIYRDRAPVVAGAAGACSTCSADFPLALKQVPAGVEVLGVSEAPVLSARTRVLSARVDGSPVIVLADAVANDRAPTDPAAAAGCGGDLRVFRRQLGGMVLYELTPLESPRLLDQYEAPAAPACHDETMPADGSAASSTPAPPDAP